MSNIYDTVTNITKKYKTRDPLAIAQAMDVDVDFADLGSLKGFYIVYKKGRFIVINKSLTDTLSGIILAHELGHDVLHRNLAENGGLKESSFFDMKSRPEMEANIFAANLLITDKEVIGYGEDGYTVEDMAKDLYVPYPLALIKVNDMNNRGFKLNIPFIPKADFLGGNI
ncbi:MAG: ImmA/IrrE family metallo-endopeptidase [Ruminiclostridium sp.]|nr:ImmA/IrrE family metallo-endopeptidase [Ruminiclostridium sp.]